MKKEELENLRKEIEKKESEQKLRLKTFYEKRENELNKMKERNLEKLQNLKISIRELEEKERKRMNQYYIKKNQIEEYSRNQNLERIKKGREKAKFYEDEFLKAAENRIKLSQSARIRGQQIIEKRIELESRIEKKKKENQKNQLIKKQQDIIKQNEIDKRLERRLRQKEYDNKLKMEQMEEREQKQEQYKKQKEMYKIKQKELSKKINNEKFIIISKFEELMKQNKSINPEVIKTSFPNDKELYEKVKELYDNYYPTKNNNIEYYDNKDNKDKK